MTDRKRLLQVNEANLRNNTLNVGGHLDFFPNSAFGGPRRNGHGGIEIYLDGLNEAVTTDIGSDPKSGKPRRFLRERKSVGRFYRFHHVKPGTFLSLEKLATAKYRLSVSIRPNGSPPTYRAAEFFAGIGLVRLALEQAGILKGANVA